MLKYRGNPVFFMDLLKLAHNLMTDLPEHDRKHLVGHLTDRLGVVYDEYTTEEMKQVARMFKSPYREKFLKIVDQVRAFWYPPHNFVVVKKDLFAPSKTWNFLHEVGHSQIPWHKDMLYMDTTHTLSGAVRHKMEREANEVASHLIFNGQESIDLVKDCRRELRTILALQKKYGASIEASVRRFVEYSILPTHCSVYAHEKHAPVYKYALVSPHQYDWRGLIPDPRHPHLHEDSHRAVLLVHGKNTPKPYKRKAFEPEFQGMHKNSRTGHWLDRFAFCNSYHIFYIQTLK